MHNPPHPGETFATAYCPLAPTATAAAAQLGVTRSALSRVLTGKAAISPEVAVRLERWLGVERGGRASLWLAMQSACALWVAERTSKAVLKKIKPVAAVPA